MVGESCNFFLESDTWKINVILEEIVLHLSPAIDLCFLGAFHRALG